MGNLRKNRIGEKSIMKCGFEAEIIAYRNNHDIDIKFTDGAIVSNRTYQSFKRGMIGHPDMLHKSKLKNRIGEMRVMSNGMSAEIIRYHYSNNIDIKFEDGSIRKGCAYKEFKNGNIAHPLRTTKVMATERLGERRYMNCGLEAEIIEYRKYHDIDIKFTDGAIVEHIDYGVFLKGNVSHPDYKKGLSETNNIAIKFPLIAATWDYSLNPSDVNPFMVSPGSDKKYYWKCPNDHSWMAAVSSRVAGRGCRECAKLNREISTRKAVMDKCGTLAEKNPQLAGEWDFKLNLIEHMKDITHPATPEQCTEGSSKNVFWKCSKGHSWRAVVYSRKDGNGCPICKSELKSSFPEKCIVYYLKKVINVEEQYKIGKGLTLDLFLSDYNIGIEYDGQAWHKDLDKDLKKDNLCYENGILLYRVREFGCPIYEKETWLYRNDNSLTSLEDIIKELLNLIVPYSKEIDINIKRDRLEIYKLLELSEKKNSLLTAYPDIARQFHPNKNAGLCANLFMPYSNKKVWWLGDCGHEWEDTINHRTSRMSGCPYCKGKKILKGFNDLESQNPEVAAQWNYTLNTSFGPDEVTSNSHKKVWWICPTCGYVYLAQIKSRNRGTGCPKCAGKCK